MISYARSFPIRKGKLRIINTLWPAVIRNHDTARLAKIKFGEFKLPCDLQEDLQRQFYFFGTYFLEDDMLCRWQREARGARFIFDVGANLGIYSFAALAAAPDATVHAFEPTPEIAAQLEAAAEMNGLHKLNVHPVAVSSANGHAKLNRCRGDTGTNGGMNFIWGDAGADDPSRVRTVCLDDFCEEYGIPHVDVLKVDVQGHEYEVFKGAEGLIKAGRIGLIFFELSWSKDPRTCPARQSICLLEQYGYMFSPGGALEWRRSGEWMQGLSDVLARTALRG
ncbi:MAG: FkbM family methyltransferase [Xanthobacteraceae bacterium]